jgi:hypothetical protein
LFVPQLRFQPLRHFERVIAHRFDVETERLSGNNAWQNNIFVR